MSEPWTEQERELADERRRLREAEAVGHVGSWETDAATRAISFSDGMLALYGLTRELVANDYEAVRKAIHPDDRSAVVEGAEIAITTGAPLSLRYRVIRANDGAPRWFETRGHAQHEGGRIVRLTGVVADITDQVLAKAESERARDAALDASRTKSEFLANMSHEIRTPLNGVIGMLELIRTTELTDQQREFADIATSSGEAVLSVISDILDFSKIEAGKLELDDHDFDLWETLEDTCEVLTPAANQKGIELALSMADSLPRVVRGDRGRLRQVITNLVANAIKFTEHGHVLVNVDGRPDGADHMLLGAQVKDSGIGMTAEHLDRLFQPFSQADSSTARRFGGTGLGLAISQQLAELMGGRISAQSRVDHGSTFQLTARVRMPDAALQTRPAGPLISPQLRVLVADNSPTVRQLVCDHLHQRVATCDQAHSGADALAIMVAAAHAGEAYDLVLFDHDLPGLNRVGFVHTVRHTPALATARLVMLMATATSLPNPVPDVDGHLAKPVRRARLLETIAETLAGDGARPAARPPASPSIAQFADGDGRVLVVEDNAVNVLVLKTMLAQRGVRADVVGNGVAALSKLATNDYDAVFMDCHLPELDGYRTTEEIRARETNSHVAVIALTASAMQGDRERCLQAGMDDYLTKPLRAEALDQVLERWLGRTTARTGSPDHRPVPPSAPATVDVARVQGLNEIYSGLADEMFTLFAESTPLMLDELRAAHHNDDRHQMRRIAHRLKGGSQNLGATQMEQLCTALEVSEAPDVGLIDQLQVAFVATCRQLQHLLTQADS